MTNHDGYNVIVESDYLPEQKKANWEIAIGLNKVDALSPSDYLLRLTAESISGEKTFRQIENQLVTYYKKQDLSKPEIQNTRGYSCRQ